METGTCYECHLPIKRTSHLTKFTIHSTCWLKFNLRFWWHECLESYSALWHRVDECVDNNLMVALGFLSSVLIWAFVMSVF